MKRNKQKKLCERKVKST